MRFPARWDLDAGLGEAGVCTDTIGLIGWSVSVDDHQMSPASTPPTASHDTEQAKRLRDEPLSITGWGPER
ncbi:hypothetical protein GCM10009735_45670 [Actinomadura chokoriensis]